MKRLDRIVSNASPLSRKDARIAIRRKRVAIDGETCTQPSTAVRDDAHVTLDGEPLADAPPALLIWHKPIGVVCTTQDPWGRRSLATEAVAILSQGLHPVGRLDAETDGLLLFAHDGALTQRLLHPRRAIRRVYAATVEGDPGNPLTQALAGGVETAQGVFTAEVLSIEGAAVTLAVTEGKHRMVRRLLANAGHPVTTLRRLSYGPIELGDLEPGASRASTPDEWAWVEALMAPTR